MNYLKYYILLIFLIPLSSCEDYFEGINTDPDNPIDVPASVILPTAEARIAYTYWGDMSRFAGLFVNHYAGLIRQWGAFDDYSIVGSDLDAAWSNWYAGTLADLQRLENKAEENGFNHYKAIALALKAYSLMAVTDYWGSVPFSEALQESEVLQPSFDTQEEIYNAIFSMLDEARSLAQADDGGAIPGSEDVIYGGDMSKWLKFINVLQARGKLHLVLTDQSDYGEVLNFLNMETFAGPEDAAVFQFIEAATGNAPMYQFNEQRGDIGLDSQYISISMEYGDDPRLELLDVVFDADHPYFTPDRAAPLLSYYEQEFIRAEALIQTGDPGGAYEAYENAIRASFLNFGLSEDAFMAYWANPEVSVGAGNLSMEEIMEQKYLALFGNPEAYTDWRRTGLPNLVPNNGSQIPLRFPYSEQEQVQNPNTPSPSEITIFDPVWWDMN